MPDEIDTNGWQEAATRAQVAAHVLDAARRVVRQGWTQDRWHVLQDSAGERRDVRGVGMAGLDRQAVVQSCLVGAVLQAAWWYSDRPEHAAPALDALWNALQERRGVGAVDPIERVCAPAVRAARVRDLTRWNDRPGRSPADVLDLLQLALARLADARV